MKKVKKKNIYIICLIICLILVSVVIPIVINESYKNGKGYITVWTGADVLSFYGVLIGGIGTIVLGVVTWKQNVRLLKIEENTFVAENTCFAIVSSVMVKEIKQNACNLNLHVEQIVLTKNAISSNYCYSIKFELKLKMLNNIPVLVHISDLFVFTFVKGEENSRSNILRANGLKNDYSRIAIGENYCEFNCTIILTRNEKDELLKFILDKNSKMLMEICFTLMTDKMVASNYKCRIKLKCVETQNDSNVDFIVDDESQPLCFWYGNESVEKDNIIIKSITEDRDNE